MEEIEYAKSLVGRQVVHNNGITYTVILVTNTNSTPENLITHPIDVVYIGQNGKIWSKRLKDWNKSFTLLNK